MFVCLCACVFVCLCVCVFVCLFGCLGECLCVCVSVWDSSECLVVQITVRLNARICNQVPVVRAAPAAAPWPPPSSPRGAGGSRRGTLRSTSRRR